MIEKRVTRKLRAVLSADAVGYSRMMQADEAWTIRAIEESKRLIGGLIARFRGRVVDAPGDNLLAEFASAVDAVECAVNIQKALKHSNKDPSESNHLDFRIGINLGDVVERNGRIYGDGVNIAARIEGLADSSGICISKNTYDQVRTRLKIGYESLGKRHVKNIAEPVQVYRVLVKPEVAGLVIGEKNANPGKRKWGIIAAVIVLFLAGITVAVWNIYSPSRLQSEGIATKTEVAAPSGEKPSIAVLPFKNISSDRKQEYLSDGITNDIITDLSKFSELIVIASNSVFVYKGKSVQPQQLNQELGARYILEGSVQKGEEKVRVNVHLIDAISGSHLWTDRYVRDLQNLFAVQDEIVQAIVTSLSLKIDAEERARVMRKDTESLEAYDYVLRGWSHLSLSTRSANFQSRKMFERAIERDPTYATAYVGLGQTYMASFAYGWTEFPSQALQQAQDLAKKAITMDETCASAHALLGEVFRNRMQYDLAVEEYSRAIALNPNDARSRAEFGAVMNYSGHRNKAIQALETARRFNPRMRPSDYMQLGLAYYLQGRYNDAIRILEQGISWYPNDVFIFLPLAATYAQTGQTQKAAFATEKVHRLRPFFEKDNYGTAFIDPADRAKIVEGLEKAGL